MLSKVSLAIPPSYWTDVPRPAPELPTYQTTNRFPRYLCTNLFHCVLLYGVQVYSVLALIIL